MLNYSKVFYLFGLICCVTTPTYSQDTLPKVKKNIIKVNLTSGFLYDVPLIFAYERLLNSYQSFTIQAGYAKLPLETNIDSLRWTSDIKSSGYTITLDYRFYLRKENIDRSPHGLYLAPFATFYQFNSERNLDFSNDSTPAIPINLKSKFNFISVGAALGYQFTFGKRWVLDCLLLGPSIGYYQADMKLTCEISESEMNDINRSILEALTAKMPMLNKLLKEDIASFTGTSSSWNYGFRYSIHFGYRF